MTPNGAYLLALAEAGLNLSMGNTQDYKAMLIVTLISIEDALSYGRTLTFDDPGYLSDIDNQLLRVQMRVEDLIHSLHNGEVRRVMQERRAFLQGQFSIS